MIQQLLRAVQIEILIRLHSEQRQDSQLHREKLHQQQRHPEARQRVEQEKQNGGRALERTAGACGAPEADRNTDRRGEKKRGHVQLDRVRKFFQNAGDHRTVIGDRRAEVERHHTAQPVQILREERLIEVMLVPDRIEGRLREMGHVLRDVERDGIAGNAVHENEHRDGDTEEREDAVEEAANDIRNHPGMSLKD